MPVPSDEGTPGGPAVAGLRVRVLGEVTATRDGRPVDLGGPRQRAVLGRLLLGRGDLVSSESLVEALWGDAPPPAAVASLQTYISHLRRRLQPDLPGRSRGGVITSAAGAYALQLPPEAVDAWRFEQLLREAGQTTATDPHRAVAALTEALALWRGAAFSGLGDPPWAEAEVARLTELRAVAGEQLLAARLAGGESALLVPELEVLVDREPLREERWRLLVLALYRSGRQADALAALRRARSVLADELGVDPGPALRALEAEVLAQSPSLDATIPGPRSRPGAPPAAPASPVAPPSAAPSEAQRDTGPTSTTPAQGSAIARTRPRGRRLRDELVERDREVAEIAACLADALDEQGRLALVSGPAGIGKSRLLAEARTLVDEAGALLLTARCSELEREFGFGAVRQLFEPLLVDPAARAHLLRGSAASAAPVFDLGLDGPGTPPEESSFATLHGLYWLTVNLASERPVVLVVDDLHWCDSGSLRFLTYLVRRLEGLPVLVLATQRTGEQATDEALIEELRLDGATVGVPLGPLSTAGLRRIIAAGLGAEPDPAFTAACFDTTNGNPLLLRQLLRALDGEGVRPDRSHADTARALGSRAIGSMVLLRLRRLPSEATALARALAVLGDDAQLPLVAALAGLDEDAAATATADLARVEVLRGEGPLSFVHALVRAAVLSDLAPGERSLLHDRAARLLARAGAPAEQVAAQLLAAPARADGWAVGQLREAASAALRRGVPEGARTFLTRALQEPPSPAERVEVLLELARAEVSIDGPSALAHLEECYALLDDPARRAAVAIALARTMVFAAERGRAPAFARAARSELPSELADERQGLLALERIAVHMQGLDADEWGLVAAGHPEPEIGSGSGADMLLAQLAWEQMCLVRPRDEVVATARRALADGTLFAVDNGLLWVVAIMVMDLADVDVMPLWEDAVALAHQRGSLFAVLSVSLWRGVSLRRRGDLPEAEESLLASIEQLGMWRAAGTGTAYAESMLVRCLVEQDRVDEARRRLPTTSPWLPDSDGHRLMLEAEAVVLLAEQRPAAAVPLLEQSAGMVPHLRNPAWRTGPALLAACYAEMGRLSDARALLDREVEVARRWGAPMTLGALLRQSGVLRIRQGDSDAGLTELEEAETILAASAARLEHGEALHELGRALLDRPTERARAVGLLLRALEAAESSSGRRLQRRVVETLAEAGVVVSATRKVGLAALTSTQRRIAMLAADGVTVREIAESLYLTPRGVEQHLAEVRRRLGIGDGHGSAGGPEAHEGPVDLAADLAAALAAASEGDLQPRAAGAPLPR